ncbi:hypothetical protein TNCV_2238921 [Trichonephila clavipes]|nr:hypothetical protein TNCV_2238921 [Trichonephila clavipes]
MDGDPIARKFPLISRSNLRCHKLCFTKHLENCSKRAFQKLRIIKSLCGTNWATNLKTLKTTYIALIRPNLEYEALIWAHTFDTALENINKIQAKAEKSILGAISSTNNLKAEWKCRLPTLLQRKYLIIKFTNKANSRETEHIFKRTQQLEQEVKTQEVIHSDIQR